MFAAFIASQTRSLCLTLCVFVHYDLSSYICLYNYVLKSHSKGENLNRRKIRKIRYFQTLVYKERKFYDDLSMFSGPASKVQQTVCPEDIMACITNQKEDRNVGGDLFVLPIDATYEGSYGATAHLQYFTVMCSASRMGKTRNERYKTIITLTRVTNR